MSLIPNFGGGGSGGSINNIFKGLASYASTTSQVLAVAPTSIQFDVATITPIDVVCTVPSSVITINRTGMYQLTFTIQVGLTGAPPPTGDIFVYVEKNGIAEPYTTRVLSLPNWPGQYPLSCQWNIAFTVGDTFAINVASQPNVSTFSALLPPPPLPIEPSASINILQIA